MMWFWFEAEGLEVAGHWCVLSTKTESGSLDKDGSKKNQA